MTVGELIKELEKYPKDLEVIFKGFEDDYYDDSYAYEEPKKKPKKKIVITQTDYEILRAFRDNGFSRETINTVGVLLNLKGCGYFRLVDNNMTMTDILDNCEIS